jgi:hypothetical protein
MQVCMHSGILLAVLTRNVHCPPHVHVGSDKWEARFEFSFWHDSVTLLDESSRFDPNVYKTEIFLAGCDEPLEISL